MPFQRGESSLARGILPARNLKGQLTRTQVEYRRSGSARMLEGVARPSRDPQRNSRARTDDEDRSSAKAVFPELQWSVANALPYVTYD